MQKGPPLGRGKRCSIRPVNWYDINGMKQNDITRRLFLFEVVSEQKIKRCVRVMFTKR